MDAYVRLSPEQLHTIQQALFDRIELYRAGQDERSKGLKRDCERLQIDLENRFTDARRSQERVEDHRAERNQITAAIAMSKIINVLYPEGSSDDFQWSPDTLAEISKIVEGYRARLKELDHA